MLRVRISTAERHSKMQAFVKLSLLDGGPKVIFQAPGPIQDEATVEQLKASLSEFGLAECFRFRIKFGKIQIWSVAGKSWTLMGDSRTLPIPGKHSGGIDWTKHIWFMHAGNPISNLDLPLGKIRL